MNLADLVLVIVVEAYRSDSREFTRATDATEMPDPGAHSTDTDRLERIQPQGRQRQVSGGASWNVGSWHEGDLAAEPTDVSFRGKSGHPRLRLGTHPGHG